MDEIYCCLIVVRCDIYSDNNCSTSYIVEQ